MKTEEAIKILEDHNKWRLGGSEYMLPPKKITEAIQTAIHLLKQIK